MTFHPRLYKAKFKSAIEREIIYKLTLIRMSGYDHDIIQQEMLEKDYLQIPVLISELSQKIQKINIIKSDGPAAYKLFRAQFNRLLNDKWYKNKFNSIRFAAQLLQYYTIVCADEFMPESNFVEFQLFLQQNEETFGNVSSNLLVIEYQLIKIYNLLNQMDDEFQAIIASSSELNNPAFTSQITTVCGALASFECTINDEAGAAPDNIFVQYLNFIYLYTHAKAVEIQFKIQSKNLIENSVNQWEKTQKKYLQKAKIALNNIDALVELYNDKQNTMGSGLEYCLGRPVLHLFPENNISRLKNHIDSLLEQ